jgi:spermidine/putrescine transport system permease protein
MDLTASRTARFALAGFFVLLTLFLYLPIVTLAIFSFNKGDVSFPLSGFTTSWYGRALSDPNLLSAIRRSLVVASVSSVLAVALGVLAAIALVRRRFPGKSAVSAMLFSPLVVPYLVFGISLLVLFTAFDRVLTDAFGVYLGLGVHAVVIGHVVVSLPYAILTILPLLERLSTSFEEAARDLGAGAWGTFRRVTFPLLLPALVSAFLIAFTISFDEYAIASFLAGDTPTWPVYLFAQLRVPSRLPVLVAVSSMVLLASIAIVLVAEIGRRVAERRYGSPSGPLGA